MLLVGGASGLGLPWLPGGAALAASFGWMLGGTPSGPSAPEPYTGNDSDTGGGDGGSG